MWVSGRDAASENEGYSHILVWADSVQVIGHNACFQIPKINIRDAAGRQSRAYYPNGLVSALVECGCPRVDVERAIARRTYNGTRTIETSGPRAIFNALLIDMETMSKSVVDEGQIQPPTSAGALHSTLSPEPSEFVKAHHELSSALKQIDPMLRLGSHAELLGGGSSHWFKERFGVEATGARADLTHLAKDMNVPNAHIPRLLANQLRQSHDKIGWIAGVLRHCQTLTRQAMGLG